MGTSYQNCDNRLILALIIEYQEFYWLIIQVVDEPCHISDHIKYLF